MKERKKKSIFIQSLLYMYPHLCTLAVPGVRGNLNIAAHVNWINFGISIGSSLNCKLKLRPQDMNFPRRSESQMPSTLSTIICHPLCVSLQLIRFDTLALKLGRIKKQKKKKKGNRSEREKLIMSRETSVSQQQKAISFDCRTLYTARRK